MIFFVNFFNALGNIINSFIGFLSDLVNGFSRVIIVIGTYLSKIPDMFVWLPDAVLPIVGSMFVVVGLYKFLGREG